MEIKPGLYLHSKSSSKMRVYFLAKHSESLEEMVVYEHLDNFPAGKFWVRPASMWFEEVEVRGEKVTRFVWLSE